MPARAKIKAGDKFGYLTVIKEVEPNITPCGTVQRKFLCKCECGNEVVRLRQTLVNSPIVSCGCQIISIADRVRKYPKGLTKHFLYTTWSGMKQRCYDVNSSHYSLYGGRGIGICDEWRYDFIAFYDWALRNNAKKHLSLDRIDNNKGYSPDNCRWATAEEQQRNKRTNRIIEYNGIKKTLIEWSNELGIKESTIRFRLDKYGFTVAQALGFEPYIQKKSDRKHLRKKIQQYDTDGILLAEWDSADAASEALGIPKSSIQRAATGVYKSTGGYIWKYPNGISKNNKRKQIICYGLDGTKVAEYDDAYIAGKSLGFSHEVIRDMCNGKRDSKKYDFILKYKENE